MLTCPTCHARFDGEAQFCPADGSPLRGRGGSQTAAAPGEPALSPAADPLVGRVLGGRYRLVRRLGQGGMGTVYRGVHTLMDKPIAVKVLRSELASDAEAVARFHREARSASRLDHDHCIRVTDFGQADEGLLYLVMELLDGESLGQVLRRGPLPAPRAAAIGAAVAEALEHAHEQGVVHRDLKPDNVFLARRSRGRELVKVLDFGLAKLIHESGFGAAITRDGTVFGTPEYMAPEQAEGEKLDGRTDLYALGVILYHALTGDVPFRANHFMAVLTKQVNDQPEPPRARRPDLSIPAALEAIVLRCLAKRPGSRFDSAAALAAALEPFAAADSSRLMLLPRPGDVPAEPARATAGEAPSQRLRADELEPTETPAGQGATRPGKARAAPPRDASPRAGTDEDSLLAEAGVPTARARRRVLGLGALGLALSAVLVTGVTRLTERRPGGEPGARAPTTAQDPMGGSPAARAEALIRAGSPGSLDEAERLLREARAAGDSSELQLALALAAEQRGNRLRALAHLERAARLAPGSAGPRARLAALLLRLGQPADACRVARAALSRPRNEGDAEADGVAAAEALLREARCGR